MTGIKHAPNRDAEFISKDLLVRKARAAYLLKNSDQEMTVMKMIAGRRNVLRTFALSTAAGAIGLASAAAKPAAAAVESALTPPGATHLDALKKRLAQAPRRRDFKIVPMILNNREQWDHEALTEVLAYRPVHKQAWDNSKIGSPWLSFMRNSLNTQIWSFKHPDFITVSVTHGTALLALCDQAMWDKYQLTRLAGEKFKTNTLIVEQKAEAADPADHEDPAGAFSSANNSIPALMRRGVVFMCCHNAIWEQAAALIKAGVNPDKLSHAALAAELTNHLVDGVVLIPGAGGTMVELQQVGFHYA
jgi:intracellular sulfur oxidation DsrE/DsrF family protein